MKDKIKLIGLIIVVSALVIAYAYYGWVVMHNPPY